MGRENPSDADYTGEDETVPPTGAQIHAGAVIGPYRLLEQIGEGGMGAVFMAEQQQPVRRRVAVKVIKPGMDSRQIIARFEAERQALALMDHPNIARVLDAGSTESGRPYFVMELVRGIPITDYCDQSKLPTSNRLELFVDVCNAVQHAHTKGVIHRDIKPSNVLVTLHDGTPVPKIIDFGVAKATNQQLTDKTLFTAFAQIVGTPAYMSPEQAEMSGLDIDTRSDIYSLGVLLYELLTGQTPIDAKRIKTAGLDEMRRLIREEDPPKPSTRISSLGNESGILADRHGTNIDQLRKRMSGELDWIVMRALEKERTRRYQSARDFAADVTNHLSGDSVNACPPTLQYRLTKYAKRNRGPVAFASTVVGLLVLSSIVAWSLFARANAALSRESLARQEARAAAEEARTAQEEAEEQKKRAQESLGLAELRGEKLQQQAYFHSISKAAQGYLDRDSQAVRTALDGCLPEQRDWEWHYLAAQAQIERRLELPVDAIRSMSASPVDDDVFVITSDGQIEKYSLADGSKRWSRPLPVSPPFKAMPSGDGKYVALNQHASVRQGGFAVLRADNGEQVWERQLGPKHVSVVGRFHPGHSNLLFMSTFDPDLEAGRVACVDIEKDETLWSRQVRAYTHLGVSQGGSVFLNEAEADSPRALIRLDLTKAGAEPKVIWTQPGASAAAVVSPDERTLITGGRDSFEVREMETGEVVERFGEAGRGFSFGMNSKSGTYYSALAGEVISLRRWSDHTDVRQVRIVGSGLYRPFGDVCFFSDTERFASTNGSSKFIDIRPIVPPLSPHVLVTTPERHVGRICFSAHGEQLYGITMSNLPKENVLSSWDVRTGRLLRTRRFDGMYVVDISNDGRHLVLGGDDEVVMIDIDSWDVVHRWKGSAWWFGFTPDGTRLIYGGLNAKLVARDLTSGEVVATIAAHDEDLGFPDHIDGLAVLDSAGRSVAVLMQNQRRLSIWNTESGSLDHLVDLGAGTNCRSLSFSASTRMLAVGIDNRIEIWDPEERSLSMVLEGHRARVGSLIFDHDSKRIFSQDYSGVLKVWDVASGEELLTWANDDNPKPHYGALALSPDGRTLASARREQKVDLWETAIPSPNVDRERRLIRTATELVDKAFMKSKLAEDVLSELATNKDLDPEVRRAAIDIANVRGDELSVESK